MNKPLLALAPLLLLAPSLQADGLDKSRVAAGTRWIAHVDVEGFLGTEIGKAIVAQEKNGDLDADLDFDEIREELGIDPLKDLKSITLYSTSENPEDAVAIVSTTANIERALEKAREDESYRSFESDGLTLHSWTDGGEGGYAYIHQVSETERVVVLSDSQARVMAGARVVRGQADNLKESANPAVTASPSPGSFLFIAAAEGLDGISGMEALSEVAGMVEGFTMELGESKGEFFASVHVQTARDEDAVNIANIVTGLKSLAALGASDPDMGAILQDLVNNVHIDTLGAMVRAEFRFPSKRLLEIIESFDEEEDY